MSSSRSRSIGRRPQHKKQNNRRKSRGKSGGRYKDGFEKKKLTRQQKDCILSYKRLVLLQDLIEKNIRLWDLQLKRLGKNRKEVIEEVKAFMERNQEKEKCDKVKKCSENFPIEKFKAASGRCETLKQATLRIFKK